MTSIYDVAVLGAGVAGSSLAKVLSEYGWDTVMLDQDTFPRHKVCGEFLSPESGRLLTALGLDGMVRALRPAEMERTILTVASGGSLELPLPGTALGISRFALDQALHEAVRTAGGTVLTGNIVTSVDKAGQGFVIRNAIKEEIQARAVIAAWGRNIRSGLPGSRGKSCRHNTYVGVKTHLEGIRSEPAVELYFFAGGYLGISPIEGGRLNMAALLTREAFALAGKTIHGAIELAARLNQKLRERLATARLVPDTQAATAPVNTDRRPVAWDMIAHIGEAAMMIPPLSGDGMAMAFFSAEICAPFVHEYLHGRMTMEEWQHQYTQAILREVSGPIRWGRIVQTLMGRPSLSRLALGIGAFVPGIANRLVKATRISR